MISESSPKQYMERGEYLAAVSNIMNVLKNNNKTEKTKKRQYQLIELTYFPVDDKKNTKIGIIK